MAGGGGSWKVAYADFTTAMMAFFMCMWILNISDPKQLDAISNWFRPSSAKKSMLPAHDGLLPNPSLKANKITAKAEEGSGPKNLDVIRSRQVKKELLELLEKDPTIQTHREAFELKVTPEGVTISVFNKPDAPIFDSNTDGFTQQGEWLMGDLAYTFDKFSEHEFEIQGHTNVRLDANGKPIDSWKLSVDRAAKTRAFFIDQNVLPEQITRVSGFGDTQTLENQSQQSPLNNRVDILIRVKP